MATVVITGGTGMIGKKLTKHLIDRGYNVTILTRKMPAQGTIYPNLRYALWDVAKQTIDASALKDASHIVHLAGAGVVDKKWTAAYKNEIVQSRTESSALLVKTLENYPHAVQTVVSSSAIGWYGEDPAPRAEGFKEVDPPDGGFLGETCKLWEASIEPVTKLGIRLVKIRTGIVLSNDGGAFPEFKRPVQFGVAGILGSGKQVVSWIHIDDLCSIYIEAIENGNTHGSYNAVAPVPVSNELLTRAIAKELKGRFYIPVHIPEFALKIMLGSRSTEVLKSTTVSSEKIEGSGFRFSYNAINQAVAELCR